MKAKIVTIGQTAIACFKSQQEMDDWRHSGESPTGPLYLGRARSAPHAKFAPLHPDFMSYYEAALAVKYRGTRKLRSGTESAKMAFMDCLPDGTSHVIIWNPLTHEA